MNVGLLALLLAASQFDMAVTFDDLPRNGPDIPGLTRLQIHRDILATLRKHRVPQVYGFINGKVADTDDTRAALAAWAAAGYPLGSHTWSHPEPGDVPAYLADIDANEPLLRSLMPGPEARWKVFRYPFLMQGETLEAREAIRAWLAQRGYRIAEPTIDFGDWAWNEPYARCRGTGDTHALEEMRASYIQAARVFLVFDDSLARRMYGRRIPHVLLLHAGAFTALMLEELLSLYESAGVHFISLDQALRDDVYRADSKVAPTRGDLLQEQIATARGTRMIPWTQMPLKGLDQLCR